MDGKYVWKDEVFKQFPLKLDSPPSEDTLTDMMDVVGKEGAAGARVEVPFWQIVLKSEKDFWSKSARRTPGCAGGPPWRDSQGYRLET